MFEVIQGGDAASATEGTETPEGITDACVRPDVVKACQGLLDAAQKGLISSFGGIVIGSDGTIQTDVVGAVDEDLPAIWFGCDMLKSELLDAAEERASDPPPP